MTLPTYVIVAQWVLLITLGLLVVVMYRQLGRVLSKAQPGSSQQLGPPPGTRAAEFDYVSIAENSPRHFVPGHGEPTVLAFVEPTCQSCERLVTALTEAHSAGDLDGLQVLLLTSEPASYIQISPAFRTTTLPIGRLLAADTATDYSINATPLLVIISDAGTVTAAGPAVQLSEARALIGSGLLRANGADPDPARDIAIEPMPTPRK